MTFIDRIIKVMQPVQLVLRPVNQSRCDSAACKARACRGDTESAENPKQALSVYSLHHYMR